MLLRRVRLMAALALGLALLGALGWAWSANTVIAQGPTYGTNWSGVFFNSTNFTNQVGTGTYPNGLNFNFLDFPNNGAGANPGLPSPDNWSARFTSTQQFQAGTYTFTLVVDDQADVFLSGTPLITNADVPGTYTFNVTINTAGTYQLQVDWIELSSTAVLQLYWTFGAGAPTTPGFPGAPGFPGTPGFPGAPGVPGATPVPTGPQAQVVNVRGLSLRSGPYLGASLVGVLRPSTSYPVLARNTDEGGTFTWYLVQAGERVGWASGRYLQINVDVNLLPFQGTEFETIDAAPDTGVIGAPRAYMNLRRRPSVRSQSLGQVPWGDQVSILGRTVQGGQSHWLHIRWNGQVGWIDADFVTVRGAIGTVPVR